MQYIGLRVTSYCIHLGSVHRRCISSWDKNARYSSPGAPPAAITPTDYAFHFLLTAVHYIITTLVLTVTFAAHCFDIREGDQRHAFRAFGSAGTSRCCAFDGTFWRLNRSRLPFDMVLTRGKEAWIKDGLCRSQNARDPAK